MAHTCSEEGKRFSFKGEKLRSLHLIVSNLGEKEARASAERRGNDYGACKVKQRKSISQARFYHL